jgi:sterol 3beta-glucosyltransferase
MMKRRKEMGREARGVSLDIPERFKDGDDAQEDVTAPKRSDTMSMNQSLFSMIARAGQQSQVDIGTMQEVDSGDSDDQTKRKGPCRTLDGAARLSRLSTAKDFQAFPGDPKVGKIGQTRHKRALSDNKLLRSLPKLKMSGKKGNRSDSRHMDQMSSSQFLPPRPSVGSSTEKPKSKDTPPKKTIIASDKDMYANKAREPEQSSKPEAMARLTNKSGPVTLATRIQQIFEFEEAEEVISEYPCWLLQSILLQGYMYITQKHICFYAYIPKKHVSMSLLLNVAHSLLLFLSSSLV